MSDHFDGRRFFNPTGPPAQPFSAVPRMLWERRTPWPARVDTPPCRPAEAVRAHEDLEPSQSIGMQSGNFQLITSRFGPLGFGESLRVE